MGEAIQALFQEEIDEKEKRGRLKPKCFLPLL